MSKNVLIHVFLLFLRQFRNCLIIEMNGVFLVMEIFKYGETEVNYLKKACPKLAVVIEEAGMLQRRVSPEPFEALVKSIVDQQISVKAAATVFSRIENLVGEMKAENFLAKTDEELQSCGMSFRKVGYIKGMCAAVASGELDLDGLANLPDKEVIAELVKLNGIGEWSAEMFMIFTSQRMDILSYGDLIIRKAIMKLYGLDQLSKKDFEKYRALYSPYGSVASMYLWYLGA